MIIWVNGTFGAGKTQTAAELQRRIPGSFLSDPERLGHGIQRMQPPSLRGDFQDDPVWTSGVASILGRLDDAYDGTLIVPMTLADPARFDEIIGGLRSFGHDVRHVSLLVDEAAITERTRNRPALVRAWVDEHAADYTQILRDAKFGAHIEVGDMNVTEVANAVAVSLGLELQPAENIPLLQRLREARTSLLHR